MKTVSSLLMRSAMIIITCFTITACDKDGKSLMFPAVFRCEVDGILYKDHVPYLLQPSVTRTPYFIYKFNEENKELYFHSGVGAIDSTKSNIRGYKIMIGIPLENPLEVGKEYVFKGIPGEDQGMPIDHSRSYSERGLPYCSVYANDYRDYKSFGTGKIVIESFNEKRTRMNGLIEFTVPSPIPGENEKLLTFKGRFEQVGIRNH